MKEFMQLIPTPERVLPSEYYFEGAEKKIEVEFKAGVGVKNLRDMTNTQVHKLMKLAKVDILHKTAGEYFDCYVLSESSLFIYPYKIIVKTCGTTAPFLCVPLLLDITRDFGMEVEFMFYSRRNYLAPSKQPDLHAHFHNEVNFLKKYFPNGEAHILGSLQDDHWYVYVADYSNKPCDQYQDQTIEILMTDLCPNAMAHFFNQYTAKEATSVAGIDTILPGSIIDDFQFEPCGYSMNGLLEDSYWTIHVTPETEFSYVSFETNVSMADYSKVLNRVLEIFRPKRFMAIFFKDIFSKSPASVSKAIFTRAVTSRYKQTSGVSLSFAGNYDLSVGFFRQKPPLIEQGR
eukprot:GCRY01002054.1.p1 GENE.GCRY01002054.1~~GCRY01002054.1.p1  ORF type:complete len:346 (+),score=40.26 GCRY01002054.1:253-1290(+)